MWVLKDSLLPEGKTDIATVTNCLEGPIFV